MPNSYDLARLIVETGERTDRHIGHLERHIDGLFCMFERKFMTSLADFAAALQGVGDQLQKALAEIQAELAAMGGSTPEMDAALARIQAAAQALDDLNPDAPPAPPPEAPPAEG